MKRLIIIATIALILQVYQANAISMTFDSNTTITTEEVIDIDETWIIEDGTTLTIENSVTNYGTIIIKGSLVNNDIIKNFGMIINNNTLINTNRITNSGTIFNNGLFNNTYVLNNLNIINNSGVINNQGYVYNFGDIHNIDNNNDGFLALFPGLVGGIFNNQGLLVKPTPGGSSITNVVTLCDISLNNNMISQGEDIIATVNTDAPAVLFEWIDPLENVQRSINDNSAPFSDTYTPDIYGEWTVKVTCDGISDSETFTLTFNVLPESPIGIIAIVSASASMLAVYMYRKSR